jgi:DNA-binding CsgD family transcriptional regulator
MGVVELSRTSESARPQRRQEGSADVLLATPSPVAGQIVASLQVTGVLVTTSDELIAILKQESLHPPQVISHGNRTDKSNLLVFKLAHPEPGDGNQLPPLANDSVGNAHASVVSDVLAFVAGAAPARPHEQRDEFLEPLTEGEARVLRYLPTGLSKREIADHLYVSVHTIKTHILHLYSKLNVHSRVEAVERARALGLLPPSLNGGPGRALDASPNN